MTKESLVHHENEAAVAEALDPVPNWELLTGLSQPTPSDLLKEREGRSGLTFTYVPVIEFIRMLNLAFGMRWSFEIVNTVTYGAEEFVAVHGRIRAQLPDGTWVSKEQFGSSDIKRRTTDKALVDIGDDLKAAASDALKKCASMLGVYLDTYGEGVAKPKKEADAPVSAKTLALMHEIGMEVYDQNWPPKCVELVEWATNGAEDDPAKLLESEARKITEGLIKRREEV